MKISTNFNLEDFGKDIPDKPKIQIIKLVKQVLQPVRDHFKLPIIVNSGYRSPEHNEAVGGVPTSQHVKGQAADIVIKGKNLELFNYLKANMTAFGIDQLINEKPINGVPSWVHVSISDKPRGMSFIIK